MNNEAAFKMIENRFSDSIKSFNSYEVSDVDSDRHYWAVKERIDLAKVALERAPAFKVTTMPRSLGDVYRTVRKNLTPEELVKYTNLQDQLDELMDKYDM